MMPGSMPPGSMPPERWQRIGEIFIQAVELDGDELTTFLDRECAGDSELRREVDSLLAADAREDPSFDQPLVDFRDPPEPSLVGRQIGRYEILEEIGRGGLGTVYLAVRTTDVKQKVALKLVNPGMATQEVFRRFEAEREILARLVHPGIARLLDGGATDDGRPYFVMEHVEGEHLDRYCEEAGLSVRARLRLFCQICDAVLFAHQNLVVHRDLKPSNVLVTADAWPRLVDFGIAKVLEPDDETTVLTRAGTNPMTLDYASPEQALGKPVATASDVYSLGVVLYELVTGERPYRLAGCDSKEKLHRICDVEPAAPHKLRRGLDGDLDSIVLKALRKEPEKRYDSVAKLAEDVRRYLRGRPVLAHQGSWSYYTGKFLRRHAVGIFVGAVLLAATVVTSFTGWQASMERDRAESERRRAERVTELLVDLFEAPDPDQAQGRDLTARELIDRGKEKALAGLDEEPEVQASLLQTLGRVYRKLGAYADTREVLEEALRIRRETLGEDDPLLAESLHDLGFLYSEQGDLAAARPLIVEAVAIQRKNAEERPLELGRGLTLLGSLLFDEGAYAESEAVMEEALEVRRRTPGTSEEDLVYPLSGLAATRNALGRPREAAELYREVLEIRRRVHGPRSTGVVRSLTYLATVLRDLGELAEAEELLREALAVLDELHGPEHPDVAKAHRRLGTVLHAGGDLEGVGVEYRTAFDVQLRVLREGHPEIAVTRVLLADLHADLGELAECESSAREALLTLRSGSWRVGQAESVLGGCLAGQGRLEEGRPLLESGYARLRDSRGEEAPATRAAAERLAASSGARGRD